MRKNVKIDKLVVNGCEESEIERCLEVLSKHANEVKAYTISCINDVRKLYVQTA